MTPIESDVNIDNQYIKVPHKHIRNLKQYMEIWGEECPPNEMPNLIVFRPIDLYKYIEEIRSK